MHSEAQYNATLAQTQQAILLKLAKVIENTDDPKEIRLCAATVAKMKPFPLPGPAARPQHPPAPIQPPPSAPDPVHRPLPSNPAPDLTPASEPVAAAPTSADHPLSVHELKLLAKFLPNVKPDRFLRKHSPRYWRDVIHRHQNLRRPAA